MFLHVDWFLPYKNVNITRVTEWARCFFCFCLFGCFPWVFGIFLSFCYIFLSVFSGSSILWSFPFNSLRILLNSSKLFRRFHVFLLNVTPASYHFTTIFHELKLFRSFSNRIYYVHNSFPELLREYPVRSSHLVRVGSDLGTWTSIRLTLSAICLFPCLLVFDSTKT